MSSLVPAGDIERIVGADRHPTEHWGRAVSAERQVYILHSVACVASGVDLRECKYSRALDRHGIDMRSWRGREDQPVKLDLLVGMRLAPAPENR
jgi:hypothetical protein